MNSDNHTHLIAIIIASLSIMAVTLVLFNIAIKRYLLVEYSNDPRKYHIPENELVQMANKVSLRLTLGAFVVGIGLALATAFWQ